MSDDKIEASFAHADQAALDSESTTLLTMIRVDISGPWYFCPTDRVVEAINAIKSGDPLPDYIYPAEAAHKS